MVRSEYMLMLDDWFIVDCCEERKKELSKDWKITVLIAGENLAIWDRHCLMKPCLRWRKDEPCE